MSHPNPKERTMPANPFDRLRAMVDTETVRRSATELLADLDPDGTLGELADQLQALADAIDTATEAVETWAEAEDRAERADAKEDALGALDDLLGAFDSLPDAPPWLLAQLHPVPEEA